MLPTRMDALPFTWLYSKLYLIWFDVCFAVKINEDIISLLLFRFSSPKAATKTLISDLIVNLVLTPLHNNYVDLHRSTN